MKAGRSTIWPWLSCHYNKNTLMDLPSSKGQLLILISKYGSSLHSILEQIGISFHAVIVFGLGKNLLFKSVLGHCDGLVSSNY